MTAAVPKGHEGTIPHLILNDTAGAIAFYKKAFGAQEIVSYPAPHGTKIIFAEIRIDGHPLYLCDDFPEFCDGKERAPLVIGASSVALHRYVEDCDAAVQQAVDAGATLAMPATDMFWGDRYAKIVDPFGHEWALATRVRDMSPDEIREAQKGAFA